MNNIKSININGKEVKKVTINGGLFWEKLNQEYTFINNVVSVDGARINLGYHPDVMNGRTELSLRISNNSSSIWNSIWGIVSDNGNFAIGQNNGFHVFANKNQQIVMENRVPLGDAILVFDRKLKIFKFNNGIYNLTHLPTQSLDFGSVFAFNYMSDPTVPSFAGLIYYIKEYSEENVLIHEFLPAIKNSTNEYGLYDIVNNTFWGNTGEGHITSSELNTINQLYALGVQPLDSYESRKQQLNQLGVY